MGQANVGLRCGRFQERQVSSRTVPQSTIERGRSLASLTRPSGTKRRHAALIGSSTNNTES